MTSEIRTRPATPPTRAVLAPTLTTAERAVACRVFEHSDELMGSIDASGCFTTLNGAWERLLGFTRAELTAQPLLAFVHPADREHIGTRRFATKDGGWRWLSWACSAHADGFDVVARDVTAQVEEDERNGLLADVVAGIDDAILTWTLDGGVVISWNAAAECLYGYTAQEAIGRTMTDLIVPADRADELETIVERLLVGEGVRQFRTQRRHRDGELLSVSLTASLLRDAGHRALGVAVVSRPTNEVGGEERTARSEIDAYVWVGRIREAIDEGRIVFHAQPIISLAGGTCGYELLCRMVGRDGATIEPASFLPVAERYGLIEELDLLAVDEGARLVARGHEISLNLSTATVGRRHIVDVIAEKLSLAGADPTGLTIEITETALMKDIGAAQRFADAVAALGCRLALDDFGTGFGGFTYLKKLAIDRLKIDVEFVRDLASSRASQHVVEAVVSLARGFGLDTVAEGVEDERSYALLKVLGVTHVQGYHLGRPGPLDDVIGTATPA